MDKSKKQKIVAYGFDSIGYEVQDGSSVVTEQGDIQFVSIGDSSTFDSFDGVIVPSGIFEVFKDTSSHFGGKSIKVSYKKELLLQRERELINLLQQGGWICCLVDAIIDEVPSGDYDIAKCDDTDLAKRILNSFGVRREDIEGSASVVSKNDEFNAYIKRWGVAKTILTLHDSCQDRKILAKIGDYVVGVEFYGKYFFLPFHSTNLSEENAELLVKELVRAIHDYIQKRSTQIPEWVNQFQFEKEEVLRKKQKNLLSELNELGNNIIEFQSFKGILTQSGDALKDTVVLILRKFFKLSVTDVEDFKEDAFIRNNDGQIIVVVEIKGTKGGIKRQYISQLDANRDRNGISCSVPGLLIINDQMGIEDIYKRRETTVAEEQIKHAKSLNILIIRTIDMLFLMKSLEQEDSPGIKLLDFINAGGGRLIVDNEELQVIS